MTIPLFTAHDVADLINALPTQYGFVPEESLCAIGTSGPRHRFGFRLRMDLPAPEHVDLVGQHVAAHLARQDCEGAIVIALGADALLAGRTARSVEHHLGRVRPVVIAWADGSRYWTADEPDDAPGTPYTTSMHHLAVVQAVAEGREVLPSRAALAERFAPVTGERRRWLAAALDDVAVGVLGAIGVRPRPETVALGSAEVLDILRPALAGERLSDRDLLRLCVWTTMLEVRDAVWETIGEDNARDMLRVWTYVARHAPAPTELAPLCLAALAAYRLGDGAQAMIALERAQALDPEYTLAGLLVSMLQGGVSPRVLAGVWPGGVETPAPTRGTRGRVPLR